MLKKGEVITVKEILLNALESNGESWEDLVFIRVNPQFKYLNWLDEFGEPHDDVLDFPTYNGGLLEAQLIAATEHFSYVGEGKFDEEFSVRSWKEKDCEEPEQEPEDDAVMFWMAGPSEENSVRPERDTRHHTWSNATFNDDFPYIVFDFILEDGQERQRHVKTSELVEYGSKRWLTLDKIPENESVEILDLRIDYVNERTFKFSYGTPGSRLKRIYGVRGSLADEFRDKEAERIAYYESLDQRYD